MEELEKSSAKYRSENKNESQKAGSYSRDYNAAPETAILNVALDETGTFRVCTTPDCSKQTANVLRRLCERERELWSRRFTPSCVENILHAENVDEETKAFFRDVEKRLKEP